MGGFGGNGAGMDASYRNGLRGPRGDGGFPRTISRLMEHSSVAFTLDQYAKVFGGHERSMVDRFDAYLVRMGKTR